MATVHTGGGPATGDGTTVTVPASTRFSVTATNWLQWTRTIEVQVDGQRHRFSVAANSVSGQLFQTASDNKGEKITVWLYDSQSEYMEPTDVQTGNEAQAHFANFAAKKAGNDVHGGESIFADVSVNINWYV